MQKKTEIKNLPSLIGQKVKIRGWIESIRDQKTVQFLIVRDSSGSVQTVRQKHNPEDSVSRIISGLSPESTVEITGKVISNHIVKLGELEIQTEEVAVLSSAESPLPIKKGTVLDHRLDWRFLDLRNPKNNLIFRLQTAIEHAMRCFWQENGFIEIHSPKLMETASESGAELFKVDYFGRSAYLAQSPQFYKQMAMAAGFEKVFEIGPVFRANPSFTSRHDTEFTSVDVEMSWIDSHEDVMQMEEEWIRCVLAIIKEKFGHEIMEQYGTEIIVPKIPFPRVTMEEAYVILEKEGYRVTRTDKGDLDPEGEKVLARNIKKKFGHEFVFVTDYPMEVRPFYHMRHPERPHLTKSYDLLWKGVEITTGAQREHRHDILVKQVSEKGISAESLSHYLDFFRYGCPPHGGYGFGLTRMLMLLLELKNVREVTYLYRGPNRLSP